MTYVGVGRAVIAGKHDQNVTRLSRTRPLARLHHQRDQFGNLAVPAGVHDLVAPLRFPSITPVSDGVHCFCRMVPGLRCLGPCAIASARSRSSPGSRANTGLSKGVCDRSLRASAMTAFAFRNQFPFFRNGAFTTMSKSLMKSIPR